jgi:predicted ATPase
MGSPGRAEVAVELERALTPTASSGATVAVLGVGGIGKSTVLAGVAGRLGAAGLRVARSVATEPTVRQPFASLPFLPDVTREPDPLAAAVAAVDQWCATGAVVIWVDDAHHLDAASSAVLTRLAGATRDLPLAVLLSARPHPRRPELAALLELTTTQIRLGPLDEADVIAAVATRMGARPGPGLLALLDVAGGNPFTIGVLLDVLQQRGALVPSDGGVEVDPSHAAAPDSAAAAVRAFLAHLPADTTDLLSTLAVLGTPAEAADVAILARRPLAALAGTLSYAVDAGVLRWSGESRVEFTHDLFPEALLADVPTQLRAVLHRDAAAILRARDAPPGQVAEHAWRGGDPASAGLVRAVAAG